MVSSTAARTISGPQGTPPLSSITSPVRVRRVKILTYLTDSGTDSPQIPPSTSAINTFESFLTLSEMATSSSDGSQPTAQTTSLSPFAIVFPTTSTQTILFDPSDTLAVGPGTSVETTFDVHTSNSLTVVKTTFQTSTIQPSLSSSTTSLSSSATTLNSWKTTSTAAPSSAVISYGSHINVAAISVPMSFATVAVLVIILLLIWRCAKPTSYEKHRAKFGTWYRDRRDRCYFHNLGWGSGATLTSWRETREKNKAVRVKERGSNMTDAATLTGDSRGNSDGLDSASRSDNALQRWRKQRQRQLEEA